MCGIAGALYRHPVSEPDVARVRAMIRAQRPQLPPACTTPAQPRQPHDNRTMT